MLVGCNQQLQAKGVVMTDTAEQEIRNLVIEAKGNLDASYTATFDNIELPSVYVLQSIASSLLAIAKMMSIAMKEEDK